MNNFNRLFIYLYSLLFCLRYLPFSTALRIPILVWPFSLKVKGLRKRDIAFSAPVRHGMVVVGFPGTEGRSTRKSLISVTDDVRIVFGDNVTLARGTQLVINGHELSIGNNFFCNGDCFFTCDDDIRIGDNCLFGWDIDLNTTDGHRVMIGYAQKAISVKMLHLQTGVWWLSVHWSISLALYLRHFSEECRQGRCVQMWNGRSKVLLLDTKEICLNSC